VVTCKIILHRCRRAVVASCNFSTEAPVRRKLKKLVYFTCKHNACTTAKINNDKVKDLARVILIIVFSSILS